MKSKTIVLCVAIFTLCFAVFVGLNAQDAAKNHAQAVRWQHLAVTHEDSLITGKQDLAGQINKLGSDGWELVAVTTVEKAGTTVSTNFFFKRPLN
jgi:hypothetical protein